MSKMASPLCSNFLTYFWQSRWCAKKWWPIKINSNSFWFLSIFYVHHEQYIVMTIKQLLWTPLLTWIAIIFRSTWFWSWTAQCILVTDQTFGSAELFGRTSTVRFGSNDRTFFILHSMLMASYHIFVLLNDPHVCSFIIEIPYFLK